MKIFKCNWESGAICPKKKERGLFRFQNGLIQNYVEHVLELRNILTPDRRY